MQKLTNGTVMVITLLLILTLGPGCQKAEPPLSPKAVTFQQEIQAVINRIAPPLAGCEVGLRKQSRQFFP